MRIARRAFPVVFLALVSAVFFGRCLAGGQTLSHDDLAYWFFPWKSLLRSMAQQGHIGFWLPWEFCGMPHMADIQRQIFYPPNVVFFLMPTATAMVGFVGFHFFVATALMYAWLRQICPHEPLEPPAALCGALVFGFAAFPVLHLSQLPMLGSYVWIPGLMLALERYMRVSLDRRSPAGGWLVVGAIVFTLMLLGGAPQMVYIACVLALAYLLFLVAGALDEAPKPKLAIIVAATLTVPLLGLGLAGLQLVPMAELTAWTARQPAVSSAYSSIGTADPRMLWTFVNPYAFGNPMDGTWTGGYTFHEECFYVGVVALLLGAAAFGDPSRGGLRLAFFLICALLGVVISLGNHVHPLGIGGHDVMRVLLPGFGKFRVPPRWMVLTVVGASVLAAFGAQALARYRVPRARATAAGTAPYLLGFCAFIGLGALVLLARRSYGLGFEQARWTLSLLFTTLTCAALGRLPGRGWLASLGLVALLAADLLAFGGAYVRPGPDPTHSAAVEVVADLAARPVGRVLTHSSVEIPTQVATWCAPFGVRNVQGTNPLFLRSYIEYLYFSQADGLPAADETGYMHHNGFFVMRPIESPMTRMLNLTDVLQLDISSTPAPTSRPSWRLAPGLAPLIDRPLTGALGLAWAVPRARVVPDHLQLLATMRNPAWDPRSEALLDVTPEVALPRAEGQVGAAVTPRKYESDLISATVRLDRDALVVFSEIYYPGWECTVDGAAAPILRANSIFRAVPMKAGVHEVVMRYRPRSFLVGLVITVGTCLVMALMLIIEMRSRRVR